jgi:quercetin dioxygenase-like cupin family protein
MFVQKEDSGYITVAQGITRKTLVHGRHTLMTEFVLKKGALLPRHQHPQEQTGYLVSGHMILTIGNDIHEVRASDSWMIPGNTAHHATIITDSVAVEVFSPVREDYLPG